MHKNDANIERGIKNQILLFSYFNPKHKRKIVINENIYECSVFNRAKLPVDLPGVKIEKIKNNKWVKINFTEFDIEKMIRKFWAITGIKHPKQLDSNEFYTDIF